MADDRYEVNEQGLPPVMRAMVIMAHPDDPEFFVGGTIAVLAAQGARVRVLLVTDGSKGSDDRSLSTRELIRLRREEQREATRRLGARGGHLLRLPRWGIAPRAEHAARRGARNSRASSRNSC